MNTLNRPVPVYKPISSNAILGKNQNFRLGSNNFQNWSQQIKEESLSGYHDSSLYSHEEFKEGSSVGSKNMRSHGPSSSAK